MKNFSLIKRLSCFSTAIIVLVLFMIPPVTHAQTQKQEWERAEALFNDGQKRFNVSDFRGAVRQWEEALAIFSKLGEKQAIGAVIGNLGNAYSKLGDYQKAISFYEKALAISEEIGDKQGQGQCLGNLGTAYLNMGDDRKAIGYYEQALMIAEEIGNEKGKGAILGNLGIAYSEIGDYRKAIGYYEQSLVIVEKIGDKHVKAQHLGHLGIVYNSLGDYNKAIGYYEQAINLDKEIGIPYDIPEGNLGDTYLALNRDDEAFVIYAKIDHPSVSADTTSRKRTSGMRKNNSTGREKVMNSRKPHPSSLPDGSAWDCLMKD